jgi:hypothetical protein
MKRYCPNRKFPPYSFIPTQNLNPNRVGGYRENINDPISICISENEYFEHNDYLFAIDLINHGYYWESHVYFEAIWNAHSRKGDIARYCKAMVKIAAGAIKHKQNRTISSDRLFNGASEIFKSLPNTFSLGVSIPELINISENWKTEGHQLIELT